MKYEDILISAGEHAAHFLGALLFVGIVARFFLRKIVFSFDPGAKSQSADMMENNTRIWLALASVAAWIFAFMVASEFMGMHGIVSITMRLLSSIPATIACVGAGALLAYSFSSTGNELVLSLIGYWYLNRHKEELEEREALDLGDEKTGTITGIAALHTTFDVRSGGTEVHSNAWAMRQFFGIGLGHKNTPFGTLKTEIKKSFIPVTTKGNEE
ncbi:hypothetical protein ACFL1X_09880 [Candidatus Hydrogenedentota bacterium]